MSIPPIPDVVLAKAADEAKRLRYQMLKEIEQECKTLPTNLTPGDENLRRSLLDFVRMLAKNSRLAKRQSKLG